MKIWSQRFARQRKFGDYVQPGRVGIGFVEHFIRNSAEQRVDQGGIGIAQASPVGAAAVDAIADFHQLDAEIGQAQPGEPVLGGQGVVVQGFERRVAVRTHSLDGLEILQIGGDKAGAGAPFALQVVDQRRAVEGPVVVQDLALDVGPRFIQATDAQPCPDGHRKDGDAGEQDEADANWHWQG
jgi:hypothetical protein